MSKIAKSMAILGVVAGLGVAALPLSSYAAEGSQRSGDVTVRVEVNSTLAVAADRYDIDFGTVNAGLPVVEQATKVTVSGTSGKKYSLIVEDKDDNTDMQYIGADGFADASVTGIKAGTPAKGSAFWGVKGGEVNDFTAVKAAGDATPVTLVTEGTLPSVGEAGGDGTTPGAATTDVTFGLSVDSTIQDGNYKDVVVFIASPKA